MSRGGDWLTAARLRRVVQLVFLVLFVALVLYARPRPGDASPWLKAFFLVDPLVLLSTMLSARAVVYAALGSLAVLALTAALGRVFCGWFCPLGSLHAAVGWCCEKLKINRRRREHWSPWQRAKYYVLAGLLIMALCGSHWVAIFDPLVFFYRSLTTAVLPGVQWAAEETSTAVYRADPHVGGAHLTTLTEPVYKLLRNNVFVVERQAFLGGGLILAIFLATLALNAYRRRWWCRYVCPLGAMLGAFAWRPLLRRRSNPACNQCDLCAHGCHGASSGTPGAEWKAAECFVCMNCTKQCRREAVAFQLQSPLQQVPAHETVSLSKRALLGSAVGGVALLAGFRNSSEARGSRFNADLLRPPGARPEREFLQRCLSCGLCMKVCPTGGLQPTLWEAGLEGIWTPQLVPRIGQCEYNCNLCGQVCPTEAIQPLPIAEKQKVKIGLASFDVMRCIPYAYGRECMVCEEHCPIPDKAIYFQEVEVLDRGGAKKTIKQPHVDPEKCIGCGICENVCPYRDRPAIRVASSNETRAADNQPILPSEGVY